MTGGTEQENDKSRKWERNRVCCERKIEDYGREVEGSEKGDSNTTR